MRRAGFTLLETIVALAVVAAVAAIVAPRIVEGTAAGRSKRALTEMVSTLRVERLEAVRGMRERGAEASVGGDGSLRLSVGGEADRVWSDAGLSVVRRDNASADGVGVAHIVFEASGRARGDEWMFEEAPGGRRWVVEFDPVSGTPALASRAE